VHCVKLKGSLTLSNVRFCSRTFLISIASQRMSSFEYGKGGVTSKTASSTIWRIPHLLAGPSFQICCVGRIFECAIFSGKVLDCLKDAVVLPILPSASPVPPMKVEFVTRMLVLFALGEIPSSPLVTDQLWKVMLFA